MSDDRARDRGSVMPGATIFVAFLMLGAWALTSASQQWAARRDVHAVAAAAARAGAQGDPLALRAGGVIDPEAAESRAQTIIGMAGYSGSVSVSNDVVTVTVSAAVNYAFPSAGFPDSVSGTSTAVVARGVTGQEGG
jgi:hypothetical protein